MAQVVAPQVLTGGNELDDEDPLLHVVIEEVREVAGQAPAPGGKEPVDMSLVRGHGRAFGSQALFQEVGGPCAAFDLEVAVPARGIPDGQVPVDDGLRGQEPATQQVAGHLRERQHQPIRVAPSRPSTELGAGRCSLRLTGPARGRAARGEGGTDAQLGRKRRAEEVVGGTVDRRRRLHAEERRMRGAAEIRDAHLRRKRRAAEAGGAGVHG